MLLTKHYSSYELPMTPDDFAYWVTKSIDNKGKYGNNVDTTAVTTRDKRSGKRGDLDIVRIGAQTSI